MFANLLNDGVLVGKVTRLQLRVDELAIYRQFETSSVGWFQLEARDLPLECREKFGRQTDGLWLIVSSGAVTQVYFHSSSSNFCWDVARFR